MTFPPTDYAPLFDEIGLAGAAIADSIDYWGHYPIVDMEFNCAAPVKVGVRAWSPFIPGDTVVSMAPGALFEIHLRNPEGVAQSGNRSVQLPRLRTAGGDTAAVVDRPATGCAGGERAAG